MTTLEGLDKECKWSEQEREREDIPQVIDEEMKWYQRSKAKHLLEGDSNTKYFQLLANGRHRKSRIFQLLDES
jgi:hypothetical protein